MLKLFRNLQVYQKMMMIFVLMLSLFYLVSIILTNYGKKNLEEQYLNSVQSKASFYGDLLDNQIYYIRTRQLQLFSNSDVKKLSFLGDQASGYEEVALMNGIKENLNNLNNASDLIANNGIVMESYSRVLSFDDGWIRDDGSTWKQLNKEIGQNSNNILTDYQGKFYFIALDKSESILSFIELSKSRLLADLSHIIEDKKDAGIFLADQSSNHLLVNQEKHQELIQEIIKRDPSDEEEQKPETFIVKNGHASYQVTSNEINDLGMTLYTYINRKELTEEMSHLSAGFLLLTVVFLIIAILFSWSINRMIHQPLNKLVSLFKTYQENSQKTPLDTKREGEFSYLYSSFNDMAERLDQSIKENYQQKLAVQKSELKQLQSQINPHFLYNGFYSIYRLSKMEDVQQVANLSQKLASYYQFITKNSQDEVEFAKEYKHALDYCDIQKIRFSNRIDFQASALNDDVKSIILPRLILQPIIENVFEHAFENSHNGILRITVTYQQPILVVTIEDNGESLTDEQLLILQQKLQHPEQVGETTGVYNVNTRLKIKYGKESGLFASRSSLGGLKIEMRIWAKEG
ncbi:sensor histidine kinase [Bacillus sp. SD088]|uniref:sensor histidine kinase n=1 Tax=Bacillus sp. SD088 TaxID=2782012 RepID=UPI001F621D88|nr:histidine kinase [Bacillus sp. SD088]